MSEPRIHFTGRRLTTPRAAAVAGLIFAILYSTAQVLIRLAVPSELTVGGGWLAVQPRSLTLALTLLPFAGIAFLWFMGVIRDHLGSHEDQFFATVLLGSGLLYLAMTFVAAAIAGGLVSAMALDPHSSLYNSIYNYSRAVIYQITNIYGIRMAGVFMLSTATIWVRTGVMPRWLAFITYPLALLMLVSISLNGWFTLVFPGWVFSISLMILLRNYRKPDGNVQAPEVAKDGNGGQA
jgi:hypothetical protein